MTKRYVYLISDGTGITAEALGNSLITQFEDMDFDKITLPYIDSMEKAEEAIRKINLAHQETGLTPLVFMTVVHPELSKHIKTANARVFDLFNTFLAPLEEELGVKSSYTVGRKHGVYNKQTYAKRIEAIEYALTHDDGIKTQGYEKADIILIGVSRCGKTPSCLYLALQYGILAANYPFTEEDLFDFQLPAKLRPHKKKLFGLTIDCNRLQQIRTERRPDSQYASAKQCRIETAKVEEMYRHEQIPYLDSTRFSIEEICTKIMSIAGLQRKF